MKEWFSRHWKLLKEAYSLFGHNHPIKFASAIAYFSLFAMPCIFLIITFLLGLIYGRGRIYRELEDQLSGVIGDDGAAILVTITENFEEKAAESIWMTIIYTVVVFWLSTQLFRLFQNSLNDLWNIKPKFDSFWQKQILERGLSFILVITCGLLFFSSVALRRALRFVTGGILDLDVMGSTMMDRIVDVLSALMVFFFFSLLYKVLPFVRIKWGPTFVGAAFTTVLFFIGVALLWQGVVKRDLEEFYEQVSSIILVALWIFYSSLIFLFGAAYTKVYAKAQDKHISPAKHAYKYKIVKDDEFHEEEMRS